MILRLRTWILALITILSVPALASANSWTVLSIDPSWTDGPSDITFTFENNRLTLNRSAVHTPGGSSYQGWFVHFAGQWAVMGTVDQAGNLLPDPYATFNDQEWCVQWASNTPAGYTAPLLLGHSFNGDNAASYEGYWINEGTYEKIPNGCSATGTFVLEEYTYYPREHEYSRLSTTFYATSPVPEPSSLLAFGLGVSGLGAALVKRRR